MTEIQRKTLGLAIASLVLGCFFWIPLLGLLLGMAALIMGIVALVQINKNKAVLKGEGMAIAGIVMGSLSILVMPLLGIMAAIAIPNLLRARVSANDALAKSRLKDVRLAVETYELDNGVFPAGISDLTSGEMPYLPLSFVAKEHSGYLYSIQMGEGVLSAAATPVACGTSGSLVLNVGPDGNVREVPCGNSRRGQRRRSY